MRPKANNPFQPAPVRGSEAMSSLLETLFDQSAEFRPDVAVAALLESVPAKWVVYLFADETGAPFQLLCVKNLRSSLQRRLGEENELAPGRRVPYRQAVRRIWWRRVDSALEADFAYAVAAEALFPAIHRQFIESRRPWWIEIFPDATHPRFVRTDRPQPEEGKRLFGPLPSQAAAGRVIETLEDAFDLCRYYQILIQAPHGAACSYKQMHKCPGPCDGSISLPMYRQMIHQAVSFLEHPAGVIQQHTARMQSAAVAMQFEAAGRVKAYVQQLTELADLSLRPLEELQFLAILRGPRVNQTKLWCLSPLEARPLACMLRNDEAAAGEVASLLRKPRSRAGAGTGPGTGPGSGSGAGSGAGEGAWKHDAQDRLAMLSYALLNPQPDALLLPLPDASTENILQAARQVSRKRGEPEAPPTDEGVVRETQ